MHAHRFDRLTRSLAGRLSRRQALAQGTAASAAVALAAVGCRGGARAAQVGTPDSGATPPAEAGGPALLFVQSFQAGSFAPEDEQEGVFTLTLSGGPGYTVYFSDRPDRIYGMAKTPNFLARMDFGPANPPNAVLVLQAAPGDELVVVLELTEPAYDETSHTATYRATILTEFDDLRGVVQQRPVDDPLTLPAQFGAANLFIDSGKTQLLSCCDQSVDCQTGDAWSGNAVIQGTLTNVPFCGGCEGVWCAPCDGIAVDVQCNNTFPACNGQCSHSAYPCNHDLSC